MKNKFWIKLILLWFLLTIIPAFYTMQHSVHYEKTFHNSRLAPIIFIPGSSATQNRFDDLFQTLNRPKTKHSILKITVTTKGKLQKTGTIAPRDKQPFIVIAFENNQDGYRNIQKQTRWLNIAMKYLTKNYNFNHFSAVGHSNGGLIWTLYLEKYFSANSLSINNLITIGTPYNSLESTPNNPTTIFHQLHQNRNKLPNNLLVYSIAGSTNYQDDGIVPYQSVEAGKYIFQKNVKKYTQTTVTGNESNHSSLLANSEVTKLIRDLLLKNDPNLMDDKSTQN
ncbi:alpha/beta hydrolase [Bombilactobacillus folatiphilus]|uniref:Alpha/beta hydrolase n=1 Tax=Bombilactobacillus folatiphilus TaxID=2923362 RepID=A0ABY4P8J8_9LACO|nr:alpha/beta hydrolase [Bombilactobacillus folatiphilus]UQS82038.1 alpha/beta hydrolase [Bombilactobacillus folatiphilus]